MKVYRLHPCERLHRTYYAWARCNWRHAVAIYGDGPFAVLAHCGRLVVTLYPDAESAHEGLRAIAFPNVCGSLHRCWHDHEIIRIDRLTEVAA